MAIRMVGVIFLVRFFLTCLCPTQNFEEMAAKPKKEKWILAVLMILVFFIVIFYFRSATKEVVYSYVQKIDPDRSKVDITQIQLEQCEKRLDEANSKSKSKSKDCPKIECPKEAPQPTKDPESLTMTSNSREGDTKTKKKKGFHFVFNLDCNTHRATKY